MFRRTASLAAGLVLAAVLAQVPEFSQQYLQRLGGQIDEIDVQVDALDARAAEAGLSRGDYVRRFLDNEDQIIKREGDYMVAVLARYTLLHAAYDAMIVAPLWQRPLRMVQHHLPETSRAGLAVFKPAVPLTVEGLAYAGAGFLGGWALAALLLAPFRRRRHGRADAV